MDLHESTALLLGGSGLVGVAVARRLLEFKPRRIIVTGLTRDEVDRSTSELATVAGGVQIDGAWGNIFLPSELAEERREVLLGSREARRRLVEDMLSPVTSEALERNLLYAWLTRYRPDVVVDCVNTATALAYQDVFASASALLAAADAGAVDSDIIERHLLTLPVPQLVRHLEVAFEGMRRAGTKAYVKIGTSGTGGMGLNIPYTHSEDKPSRTLMTKSAVAGAHSLFLFLLGRTPGAPATIEIKPTAAIAWREIGYGTIRCRGRTLELVDCEHPLPADEAFAPGACGWVRTGQPLEGVYIDVGENGVFARDEFETVSALGQMELVTPEEIAETVVMELSGRPTGRDIVSALDAASMGPTYRGGYLRAVAVEGLRALEQTHGVRSIAFEMLGPPRLTKLLYEAHILSCLYPTVRALAAADAAHAAQEAEELIRQREPALRRQILSVGLPVLLTDGMSVLRGETVVVPPGGRGVDIAPRGWVDLRVANLEQWVGRARAIAAHRRDTSTGSRARDTWPDPDAAIAPSRMAVWV
ncbi:MAG: short-chain dehydrogenase, partial [Chloroflexota bacterium]|nr:short-chain dehydrogenase [Chloroflexota bacterium]